MMKRLQAMLRPDVVVLPRPPMEKFDKAGTLRAGTLVNLPASASALRSGKGASPESRPRMRCARRS